MTYVLALDIGGTNPRLAMMHIKGENDYVIIHQATVDKELPSVIPAINDFLTDCAHKGFTTNMCCASVAGPVDTKDNACYKPTNAKFPVVGNEIREQTALDYVLVINDFRAIGEYVATIDLASHDDTVIQLTSFVESTPASLGNRGVIGPGTGLGVAYLIKTETGYVVSASEGGHAGFSVVDGYEQLYSFLLKKLNTTVLDTEALVSGQGIRHIIDFFLQYQFAFEDIVKKRPRFEQDRIQNETLSDREIQEALEQEEKDGGVDVAALVATNTDTNFKARITMRLFMEFLGAASQGVALHGLTTGGLFIAGGIPAKNQQLLGNGDFMNGFTSTWKAGTKELLLKIPVYLVTNYDVSFYGCARAAHNAFMDIISPKE